MLSHMHTRGLRSRVIAWIRRLFETGLGWEHGVQFMCVAFQNRMAAAIGGTTLHNAGNLSRPGAESTRTLGHSEVDNLFVQNESLRWILLDEVSMVAHDLLGEFEWSMSNAARESKYLRHLDTQQRRPFGG